ncbi:hypothetical protein [Paenibacillus eucommiae]|uniref:ABC transporter permease n=1 Tax=Paenibacillus eucommiae TaxID=1355755 RepID=A0ABS4J877_9BACL|nr:hypothetical protein [Paenibacillus eucommiae]MBP1996053.1 hypothetical protein [Paenibacillus eucommiae]
MHQPKLRANFPKLIYYNAKISGSVYPFIGLVYVILICLMFNLRFVDFKEMAQIGEMYVSLLGIFMLPHITMPEQTDSVHETIFPRSVRHVYMVLIRIVLSVGLLGIMVAAIALLAYGQGGQFSFPEMVGGVWISTVLLGAVGLTIATITGNIAAAYIGSFMYYVLELFTKGKYTGDLYLFSLLDGRFESGKFVLAVVALVLLAFNLWVIWRRS